MILVGKGVELRAATVEILRASVAGDRATLARLVDAEVAAGWPPPLFADDQARVADQLAADPSLAGWFVWLIVSLVEKRTLCGIMGFSGPPTDGTIEVGYAVCVEHQNRGLATSALRLLVEERAFRDRRVRRVIAHTFPDLAPSIRVLVKAGFRLDGPGDEPGTLRYVLTPTSG